MGDLAQVFEFVMDNEDAGRSGAITTGPDGRTQWGISEEYNPGAHYPMTLAEAQAIYVAKYFDPFHVADIRDQGVANLVGDFMVNPGPEEGGRLIQQAVNMLYPGALEVDGHVGPVTVSRLNGCVPSDLLPRLRAQRALFYVNDTEAHPERAKFLMGWLVRACR
jgi:lysozyme family protein